MGFSMLKKEINILLMHPINRSLRTNLKTPFEFDYSELLYRKQEGTSKRAYYTFEGIFLGEYPEDTLNHISDGYYFAKPNKFQKKINIIQADGSILRY
jgi:hypothetical protein